MKKFLLGSLFISVLLITSCATTGTTPESNNESNNELIGQWVQNHEDGSSNIWDFKSNTELLQNTYTKDKKLLISSSKHYSFKGNEMIIQSGKGAKFYYYFNIVSPNVLTVTLDVDRSITQLTRDILKKAGYTDDMFNEMGQPVEMHKLGIQVNEDLWW